MIPSSKAPSDMILKEFFRSFLNNDKIVSVLSYKMYYITNEHGHCE